MNRYVRLLLLSLCLAWTQVPAAASESSPPPPDARDYPAGCAVFKFGGYIPDNGIYPDAESHYSYSVGLGVFLHPLLGFELGVGGHNVDAPATVLGIPMRLPIEVYPITLSEVVQHRWRMGRTPASVYALAGPGLFLTIGGEDDEQDWAPGLQVGIGMHAWMLGVEARYYWATATLSGREIPLDGLILSVNGGAH